MLPVAGLATPVGVVIKSADVELDLAGFSIGPAVNQPGIGTGFWLDTIASRIRMHNGHVQNVATGVSGVAFAFVDECIIERLQIVDCSASALVINGKMCAVRGCTITNVANADVGIGVISLGGAPNEVSDCTVLRGGGAAISSGNTDGLIVRRCLVTKATTGIAATSGCKLIDNTTLGCATKFTGNPVLAGINDGPATHHPLSPSQDENQTRPHPHRGVHLAHHGSRDGAARRGAQHRWHRRWWEQVGFIPQRARCGDPPQRARAKRDRALAGWGAVRPRS